MGGIGLSVLGLERGSMSDWINDDVYKRLAGRQGLLFYCPATADGT